MGSVSCRDSHDLPAVRASINVYPCKIHSHASHLPPNLPHGRIGNWLKAVHANGIVLARTRVAGPWGFRVTNRDAVIFHLVAEGSAFVRLPDAAPFELFAGELVSFPAGSAHEVTHSERGKSMPLEKFLALRDGVTDRAAQATTLLCGEFRLDRHLAMPAIRALPSVLHLRATETPRRSALTDTLRLLRAEVETTNFGNQIVVRSLISALFVYFMRNWGRNRRGAWRLVLRRTCAAYGASTRPNARGAGEALGLGESGKRGRSLARRVCAAVQFDGWGTAPQISDALADGNRFPSILSARQRDCPLAWDMNQSSPSVARSSGCGAFRQ